MILEVIASTYVGAPEKEQARRRTCSPPRDWRARPRLAVVKGNDFQAAREFARSGAVQPRTKKAARQRG